MAARSIGGVVEIEMADYWSRTWCFDLGSVAVMICRSFWLPKREEQKNNRITLTSMNCWSESPKVLNLPKSLPTIPPMVTCQSFLSFWRIISWLRKDDTIGMNNTHANVCIYICILYMYTMCVYVYVYMYICAHAHTHIYIHTHAHHIIICAQLYIYVIYAHML